MAQRLGDRRRLSRNDLLRRPLTSDGRHAQNGRGRFSRCCRHVTKEDQRHDNELAAVERGTTSNLDRLATTRGFRSVSGIEWLDRLATEYPELLRLFLRDVEAGEWVVKESRLLDSRSPAYFFPRKGRFYYDSRRMTYLDMLHEGSHLESFARRGNWKLGKASALAVQDEVTAYSLELRFLREIGGARPEYLEYLERQIAYYRRLPETLRGMRGGGP